MKIERMWVQQMTEQLITDATRQIGESAEEGAEGRYKPYYVNGWAAVIGINNYPHLSKPLTYAVADAEGVADLLVTQFDFPRENVFVILDPPPLRETQSYQLFSGSATKAAVEELLLTFLPGKAQPDDRVFIFFAGHGQRRPLANNTAKGYLMPADATPGAWHQWIELDSILDSNLYSSKHVFYVLDACYSGLAATRSPETASRYQQDLVTRRARQVLTAGKDNQVVADMGGEGHSIFTHYVLQGLSGEARQKDTDVITAFDLMRYVTAHVGQDTNSAQTPDEGTRLGHGGGDFVFRFPEGLGSELSPQEQLELGLSLYQLGQELDDRHRFASAREQLTAAISRPGLPDTELAQAQIWIAKTFMAESDLEGALGRLTSLLGQTAPSPPADLLLHLTVVYAKRRELELATSTLTRFLDEYPDSPEAAWANGFLTVLQAGSSGRCHALLVGNDISTKAPNAAGQWYTDLPGCANDVKLVKQMLVRVFGFAAEEVRTLTGVDASRQRIFAELEALAGISAPGDTIVFFRSGHASIIPNHDGQRVAALLVYDAQVQDHVTETELYEAILRIPAGIKWMIFDSGGDSLVGAVKRHLGHILYVNASPGQVGYEFRVDGQPVGAFTYALTSALQKSNPLTITHGELLARTIGELKARGFEQTPQFIADPGEPVLSPSTGTHVPAWEYAERRNYAAFSLTALRDVYRSLYPRTGHVFTQARYGLGIAFLEKADYLDATDVLQPIAQEAGLDPDVAIQLGMAQLGTGDYGAAGASFRNCLASEQKGQRRARLKTLVEVTEHLANSQRYALLVGINAYADPAYPAVKGATNDVKLLKWALINYCGFEEAAITVLLDAEATRAAILDHFAELTSHSSEAVALFYFAGDGTLLPPGMPALLSTDARPGQVEAIPLPELMQQVPQPNNLVTVIDAGWYGKKGQESASRLAISSTGLELRSSNRGTTGGLGNGPDATDLQRGSVSIFAQDFRPSVLRNPVTFESERTKPWLTLTPSSGVEPAPQIHGNLTYQLVASLIKAKSASITYEDWVRAASRPRQMVKPALYGLQSGQRLFTNGILLRKADELAREIVAMRFDYAIALLERLIRQRELQHDDGYPEGQINLGLFYGAIGDFTNAIDRLMSYAEPAVLEPGTADEAKRRVLLSQIRYHSGRLLYEARHDLGTAVDKLKRAAEIDRDDPRIQFYLGQSLRALVERENLKDAADALQKYLEAGAPLGFVDDVRAFLRSREQRADGRKTDGHKN